MPKKINKSDKAHYTQANAIRVPTDLKAEGIELPTGGPKDREAYIEYALDMVLHNLVSSGQVDGSKSYLLKTAEMRAHIGRMCDRVRKEQAEEGRSQLLSGRNRGGATRRWALNPNSLPISIISDKEPVGARKSPNQPHPPSSKLLSSYGKGPPKIILLPPSAKAGPLKDRKLVHPKSRSREDEVKSGAMPLLLVGLGEGGPQSSGLVQGGGGMPADGTLPMTDVPAMKGMKRKKKDSSSTSHQPLKAGAQAFRAKLDMRGFKNEEISLDMDGRKLTITGMRGKGDGLNARKATESIEIPDGVNVDNLKIARRMDGMLVIEETVLDTDTIF